MSDEIKYTLNVQSVDNPLTKEVGDKRFVLVSNGTADFDRVISEIMAVNPGLERETVEAVISYSGSPSAACVSATACSPPWPLPRVVQARRGTPR